MSLTAHEHQPISFHSGEGQAATYFARCLARQLKGEKIGQEKPQYTAVLPRAPLTVNDTAWQTAATTSVLSAVNANCAGVIAAAMARLRGRSAEVDRAAMMRYDARHAVTDCRCRESSSGVRYHFKPSLVMSNQL